MTKIKKSVITKRLINSYFNGISKSMDANNNIHIFNKHTTASVKSAWKDIGVKLINAMDECDKETRLRV